jgi:DnaK suppressor protein
MDESQQYVGQIESLKQDRERIVKDLERWREALKTEVDPDADEGDPDLVEREKVVALVSTLERKLDSVNYALRRVDEGVYGICERCGNPINPERLEAKPEATLCIECMAVVERLARANSAPKGQ